MPDSSNTSSHHHHHPHPQDELRDIHALITDQHQPSSLKSELLSSLMNREHMRSSMNDDGAGDDQLQQEEEEQEVNPLAIVVNQEHNNNTSDHQEAVSLYRVRQEEVETKIVAWQQGRNQEFLVGGAESKIYIYKKKIIQHNKFFQYKIVDNVIID